MQDARSFVIVSLCPGYRMEGMPRFIAFPTLSIPHDPKWCAHKGGENGGKTGNMETSDG